MTDRKPGRAAPEDGNIEDPSTPAFAEALEDGEIEEPSAPSGLDPLIGYGKFLGSAQFAVYLIILLALSVIAGTLIIQNVPEGEYLRRFGPLWGKAIWNLGLDDMYHAPWFIGLLAFIGVNLVVSSFRRFTRNCLQERRLAADITPADFDEKGVVGPLSITLPPDEAAGEAARALQERGFRVQRDEKPSGVFLYGDRWGVRRWGSFIAHLGLITFFISAIVGAIPNVKYRYSAVIPEGGNFALRHLLLYLTVSKFTARADANGRPTEYRTDAALVDQSGTVLATKAIQVNEPLDYRGIKFYQTGFGTWALRMQVRHPDKSVQTIEMPTDAEDQPQRQQAMARINGTPWVLFVDKYYPQAANNGDQVFTLSKIPESPVVHFFIMAAKGKDNVLPLDSGYAGVGQPAAFRGYTIALQGVQAYTVLEIRRDPTFWIVMGATILTVVGLIMALCLPRRDLRIWVEGAKGTGGTLRLLPTPEEEEAMAPVVRAVTDAVGAVRPPPAAGRRAKPRNGAGPGKATANVLSKH